MSTLHSIQFHVVFWTKHRKPWIKDDWIGRLHAYLGGAQRGLDAVPVKTSPIRGCAARPPATVWDRFAVADAARSLRIYLGREFARLIGYL